MITCLVGDATKPVGEGKKIIAHCCNNIGLWGVGFVLALSGRWKEPEKYYREMYENNKNDFRKLLGVVQFVNVNDNIIVANLIGQNGVRGHRNPRPVSYEAFEIGLQTIDLVAIEQNATIHMPRIGCSLGGGSWAKVEEIINRCIKSDVYVYDFPESSYNP